MKLNVIVAMKDRENLRTILKVLRQQKEVHLLICLNALSETVENFNKGDIDAVFIDTDILLEYSIESIKRVLCKYNKTKIILISPSTDYLNLAFDIVAVGYIIKPVQSSDVFHCMKRLLELNALKGSDSIIVHVKRKDVFVHLKDILYIEASNRNCVIHTRTDEYRLSRSFAEIIGALPEDIFFKSHRSFVINIWNVKYIERYNYTSYTVCFDNNKTALLSKRCERLFKDKVKNNLISYT